jgi:hypothetical protein
MQSHQTDATTQAGGAGLSEQDLASVSGGALTPEQLQQVRTIASKNIDKENKLFWPVMGTAAFTENLGNFGAHVGGEQAHKGIFNKSSSH